MNEIFATIVEGLTKPFTFFINPAQRLFIPALVTSLLIAIGAYFYYQSRGRLEQSASFRNMLAWLFPKKIWTNRSSVVDYQIILFNSVIYSLMIGPFLVYLALLSEVIRTLLVGGFGEVSLNLSHTTILVSFTIVLFVVDDFLQFFEHWLFHKVPFLWVFHKVHHSALVLTPFTNYRSHPLESAVFHCRRIFSLALVTGVFLFLVGNDLTLLDTFYAGMARKIFNHAGSNLRHTHIWVSWGNFMEHIFISPAQHQIHHSNALEHRDKNMGSCFAFWDWMFGALVLAGEKRELELGIGDEQNRRFLTLHDAVAVPFVDAWRMIWRFPEAIKRLAWTRQ